MVTKIHYNRVWKADVFPNVRFFSSGLEVDADGASGQGGSGHAAYGPHDNGLDFNENAGYPGKCWGLAMDAKNRPCLQGKGDPAPGYFVSTTALEDKTKPDCSPYRYVDAESVPFLVIPSTPKFGAKLGHLAMVLRPSTGDSSAALVADIGPAYKLGEGSIKLAQNLGVPASPKHGGVAGGIYTILFTRQIYPYPQVLEIMAKESNRLFKLYGGFQTVKAVWPAVDWSRFLRPGARVAAGIALDEC